MKKIALMDVWSGKIVADGYNMYDLDPLITKLAAEKVRRGEEFVYQLYRKRGGELHSTTRVYFYRVDSPKRRFVMNTPVGTRRILGK